MAPCSTARARFGVRFSLLARRWRRVLDVRLAEVGLTGTSWVPLVHLEETGGGLTQKELALLVGVDGSSLVRVLDILERDGLIERRRDEHDGRARRLYLTVEGTRRVAEIRQSLTASEEAMLVDMSDSDIVQMLEFCARIDARLNALEHPLLGEAY
jgi:MarR family transcriptional regulator for hemolysin